MITAQLLGNCETSSIPCSNADSSGDDIFLEIADVDFEPNTDTTCDTYISTEHHNKNNYKNPPERSLWGFIKKNFSGKGSVFAENSGTNDKSVQYSEVEWIALVKENPLLLSSAPKEIRSNKNVVLAAVSNNGKALQYASDELRNDRDVVLAAVSYSGDSIQYASAELMNDKELLQKALSEPRMGRFAFEYISEELRNDPDFIRLAIYANYKILEYLDPETQKQYAEIYNNVFSELGIEDSGRIDRAIYKEIVRNRYAVSSEETKQYLISQLGEEYFAGVNNDNRPVCVIALASEDHNGAFGSVECPNQSSISLTKAYRVIYYEVSTDKEFSQNLREATTDNGQQADLLLIGGHGSQFGLQFGNKVGESAYLDIFCDWNLTKTLKNCVSKNGNVVLCSCDAGRGRKGLKGVTNFAEFIHKIWPDSTVHAATQQTNSNLVLDEKGLFESVYYVCGYDEDNMIVLSGPPDSPRNRLDILGIIWGGISYLWNWTKYV